MKNLRKGLLGIIPVIFVFGLFGGATIWELLSMDNSFFLAYWSWPLLLIWYYFDTKSFGSKGKIKPLIQEAIKSSIKNGEREKTTTLSVAISEIQREELDKGSDLSDREVTAILQRMIKQRKDSSNQIKSTIMEEFSLKEGREIETLSVFLPEQLSEIVQEEETKKSSETERAIKLYEKFLSETITTDNAENREQLKDEFKNWLKEKNR